MRPWVSTLLVFLIAGALYGLIYFGFVLGDYNGQHRERRAYLDETDQCTTGLKGFKFCDEWKCVMKTHVFRDNEVWRCNWGRWEPIPEQP